MADKSTSSKGSTVTAETPVAATPKGKIYPIVKYGDPVLEKPAATIAKFDAELEHLVEDMFASMYAANGVGLAAPQIGKSIRLAVVDVTVAIPEYDAPHRPAQTTRSKQSTLLNEHRR